MSSSLEGREGRWVCVEERFSDTAYKTVLTLLLS